ncbi:hypothetical protein Dole_0211 [Desulfosudis oleivorans Hxd3]|uniref:Uncharacterized protein n=1 Tax=Desulfosudis oleivorans (strain DSM 6200 / JCM 39069 / Hxd3) TaxID=96561 RepID=A8ZS03_DESOH|nr:hypothetical protein Dole_0211 [Desulfosudis oleivorans Hxd3]
MKSKKFSAASKVEFSFRSGRRPFDVDGFLFLRRKGETYAKDCFFTFARSVYAFFCDLCVFAVKLNFSVVSLATFLPKPDRTILRPC